MNRAVFLRRTPADKFESIFVMKSDVCCTPLARAHTYTHITHSHAHTSESNIHPMRSALFFPRRSYLHAFARTRAVVKNAYMQNSDGGLATHTQRRCPIFCSVVSNRVCVCAEASEWLGWGSVGRRCMMCASTQFICRFNEGTS